MMILRCNSRMRIVHPAWFEWKEERRCSNYMTLQGSGYQLIQCCLQSICIYIYMYMTGLVPLSWNTCGNVL